MLYGLQRYVTGIQFPEGAFPVHYAIRPSWGILLMPYRVFRVFSLIACVLLLILGTATAAAEDNDPRIDPTKPHTLPYYPDKAKRHGVGGTVVVAVHVNELGKPFDVQTASSSGSTELDKVSVAAVRGWRFLPATRDGEEIAEWTAIGFKFGPDGVTQVEVSPDTAVARADRNRVICKVDPPKTGSHIPDAAVCMPKWEWDERARRETLMHWAIPTAPAMGGGGGSGK